MRTVSKITLDAETFKALASATRLTVLKALGERRKTLTELSRDLALNKATVHEHLQLLLAADLVRKRDDEGRKWIYYELTWTGQKILRPEATTSFSVLLGLSALAAGGVVFTLGQALDWWGATASESQASGDGDAEGAAIADDQRTAEGQSADGTQEAFAMEAPVEDTTGGDPGFFDDGGWLALALVATFLLFCALAFALRWKLTPKPFDPASAAQAEGAAQDAS